MTTMRLGAEKSMRLIVAQVRTRAGLVEIRERMTGLCFEPGATLDALMLQNRARHADAASMSVYLLPALAAFMTALLSLQPSGILAKVTADLLAVAILPTVLALVMPGLNLLFDIPASENRYRWRTFATHALVPALIGTAAARILAPFSWTAGAVTVIAGYAISVRMYYQCCNDWIAVPDQRRLQASALFLGALMVYGLVAALLFQAGLIP